MFTRKKNSGEGFRVIAGGYLGLFIGGKRIVHDEYRSSIGTSFYDSELSIKAGNKFVSTTDFYSKRIDLGIQAGLGYKYKATLLQLTYSFGLENIVATYSTLPVERNPTYHNRTLAVSLSCFLKNKINKP